MKELIFHSTDDLKNYLKTVPNDMSVHITVIMDKEYALGYHHVLTPAIGNVNLYKTSGHWDHYKD